MRRLRRSPSRDEHGFTLVELLIGMTVMSVVATAAMAVALRTTQTTLTVTDRRDVFTDGRFALDQMTEDLRQGESIDVSSDADTVEVPSYVNGSATTVIWRATGSAAPYGLERSIDGGTTYVPLLDSLASNAIFTYTTHEGVLDQVTVAISLTTSTTTVGLTTDVYLRNANS
ncbi:MAG: prepilin-type N-terminal cleavage/methylation domain-containing protein [Actinomycetota bacterium]